MLRILRSKQEQLKGWKHLLRWLWWVITEFLGPTVGINHVTVYMHFTIEVATLTVYVGVEPFAEYTCSHSSAVLHAQTKISWSLDTIITGQSSEKDMPSRNVWCAKQPRFCNEHEISWSIYSVILKCFVKGYCACFIYLGAISRIKKILSSCRTRRPGHIMILITYHGSHHCMSASANHHAVFMGWRMRTQFYFDMLAN